MVTFPEEMIRIRGMVEAMSTKMRIKTPPLGAMIETPAAALSVKALRRHAEFLCIGTNDLTQYVMAADRESALVSAYFRDDSPIILDMIGSIVGQAGRTSVTLCGELAAKPEALARLLKTGLTSLSVAAVRIPAVKESIRNFQGE
jgi:phosphoenolpyruvate-protein kinase (PTS system EI component)